MKNLKKYQAVFVFLFCMFLPTIAHAARFFSTVGEKMGSTLNNLQVLVAILGGFGLVCIACGAIFGKMDWKKAGSLAFGLVIVVIPLSIIATLLGQGMEGDVGQMALNYDVKETIGGATITPSD